MSQSEKIISVKGLTKSFGKKVVVRDLSMSVNKGEIYGFLGPNGSGKTTTIRMLCGLLNPDKGTGTCLGHDIFKQSHLIKPLVGYMSQHFSLYEDLTVLENLQFIARLYGFSPKGQEVQEAIERLSLNDFTKVLAQNLSGGWKQRLALAGCLLHKPKLLLLDEPTAGVDPKARREFWDLLAELAGEGITALISTHYMDEAQRCSRLAYIAYGDLLTWGTSSEVVARQGLCTWQVTGENLLQLNKALRGLEAVDQVIFLGNELHISGSDSSAMLQELKPYMRDPWTFRKIPTSLEEVFVSLMTGKTS